MRRFFLLGLWFVFARAALAAPAATPPEALLVIVGDQHSAYERTAQFVGHVDRLKRENPGVPLAVLINGDSLEYGNIVARRTAGAVDFAMFTALARRAPTILNLGNHEPEFYDVAETVKRLTATGVRVISGNLRAPGQQRGYAEPATRLTLGAHEAVVVGVTTDLLATFRVAVRPQLDLADPVVWAQQHFPALLGSAPLPIVLSHAGLRADRGMLPLVPAGTLFAGAHDHLRFVHTDGATVYVHSGSWMDYISVARLERSAGRLRWRVEQVQVQASDPADPTLAQLVQETLRQHLTSEETAIVGRTTRTLPPAEAAAFAVAAARAAARADVALIGATTFGAGLPAGEVTRYAFDACVRFDGNLHVADVDGAWLQALLARTNQGPDTPFAARSGENLLTSGPDTLDPKRRYRFVTTDWVAKNASKYLGENPPSLQELADVKLKAAVLAALQRPR